MLQHNRTVYFVLAITLVLSSIQFNSIAQSSRPTLLTQKDSVDDIEIRHKANYDFYRRVLSFSRLSWASLPFTDYGSAKDWYIISADVSPHFNIGGERFPFVVQITPRYMVRIFRNSEEFSDSSLPVRTPSYRPGATVYIPLTRKRKDANDYDWYRNMRYFSAAFFHHSNGQDGPELLENGTVNVYDGNFSTNYFETNFHFNNRFRMRSTSFPQSCNGNEDCAQNEMPHGYRDVYGKVGLQQHFNTTDPLRERYGTTRINFSIGLVRTYNARLVIYRNKKGKLKTGSEVDTPQGEDLNFVGKLLHKQDASQTCEVVGKCYQKEHIRFIANTSLIVNRLSQNNSLSRKVNVDLGMYLRMSGNNTAWFLMAGYYGSDPYNIYFMESYFFIRTGIALGFFNYTNKFQYE